MRFWWNFIKTLYGHYGSNHIVCIVSWSEFARNIAKFNIDWTICDFDKDWSKLTKWTIRINPYCPWLNFSKIFQVAKKSFWWKLMQKPWKGNMVQNLINMVQTLSWSKFSTNIAKFNTDWTICYLDKDWMDNMDQPIFSLIKNFQRYFR